MAGMTHETRSPPIILADLDNTPIYYCRSMLDLNLINCVKVLFTTRRQIGDSSNANADANATKKMVVVYGPVGPPSPCKGDCGWQSAFSV